MIIAALVRPTSNRLENILGSGARKCEDDAARISRPNLTRERLDERCSAVAFGRSEVWLYGMRASYRGAGVPAQPSRCHGV